MPSLHEARVSREGLVRRERRLSYSCVRGPGDGTAGGSVCDAEMLESVLLDGDDCAVSKGTSTERTNPVPGCREQIGG